MKRLILVLALAAPLAAAAQATPTPSPSPTPGQGMGPGRGMGRGMMGPGWKDGDGPGEPGKRGKLALTLGLAEAMDLDDAQALKLRDAVEKFHQKRAPLHDQLREAMQVLRKAADGEKVDGAEVDKALAKVLDLRAQAQAADRELVQTVTKDQPPQKKARAALFLARFQRRMDERMGPMGRGMRGPGGPGMQGPRRGGPGPGRGPCGQGLGPCGGAGAGFGPGPGPTGALEVEEGDAFAAAGLPPPPEEDEL